MVEAPIYDPKNFRHTEQELGRYQGAAIRALADTQFVSMAGPDMTKVGTDYPLCLAALMNQESGLTMWGAPQA